MADAPRTPDEQPTVELPDLLRDVALPSVTKDDGPIEVPRIVPASSGTTGRTRTVPLVDAQPTTQALPIQSVAPPPTEAIPVTPPGAPEPTVAVPVVSTGTTPGVVAPGRVASAAIARQTPVPGVRRSLRVVRQIDTWSVFKVALVFHVFLYIVCLTTGALLWRVAQNTGTVDNVERFFENFGWTSFEFNGGAIYHEAWVAGLFAVVGLTGVAVLLATVFNLITDLVGGIKVTVLEEEFSPGTASRRSGHRSGGPQGPKRSVFGATR